MRLDKFICDCINITRNQAKEKILSGMISVDGVYVRSPSKHIDEKTANVTLSGKKLNYTKYVYLMMNKPKGVISSSKDRKCKTALDLLSDSDRRHDLFIAGRLDKDTTGFLLITNNGDFAHSVLSPKRHVKKTYRVTLQYPCEEQYGQAFSQGILLSDGYRCMPAEYRKIGDNTCLVKISEGKYHQIKRMFATLGNSVVELSRVTFGNLPLDSSLKPGEYRYITTPEIKKVLAESPKRQH